MKTINDLLEEYNRHLRTLQRSENAIRKQTGHRKEFLRWLDKVADIRTPDKLQAEALQRWHEHLGQIRTLKKLPLAAVSLNRHIVAVRSFLQYLHRKGYVHERILDNLPYVKEPKRLSNSVLNHSQMRDLLDRISLHKPSDYRNRAMLELLYSSGLRAGEILGMDLDAVDYGNRTAIVLGKGNKQRMVPIGKTAMRHIENYLLGARPYLLKEQSERALFVGFDGKRLSYGAFRNAVHVCAKRAGVEINVTPHTFRRSCATELIRGDANMYHVKELLGHESLATLNRYARLTIVDLKKTHERCHPREREERCDQELPQSEAGATIHANDN